MFWVVRRVQVRHVHLEVDFGASIDVGYSHFFKRFRPWGPINFRFGRNQIILYNYATQDSGTTTLPAAARCCVTTTLAA